MGNLGAYTMQTYWLMSVIERAKSTDPEKIIKIWEKDTYKMDNGKILKMRACDHKVIQDLAVSELSRRISKKCPLTSPHTIFIKESPLMDRWRLFRQPRFCPGWIRSLIGVKGRMIGENKKG